MARNLCCARCLRSSTYEYTPAGALDEGTVFVAGSGNNPLAVAFKAFGASQFVSLTGIGAADSLVFNGTAASDVVTVTATTGRVSLASRAPVIPVLTDANTTGSQDEIRVVGSVAGDIITVEQAGVGTAVTVTVAPATDWMPLDFNNVEGLAVWGESGNGRLDVDNSGGSVNLPSGIAYDGGTGSDLLRLMGTTAVSSVIYNLGSDASSGSVVHEDPVGTVVQTVFFTGLEPVIDIVDADTLTINATDGDDAINYNAGPNSGGGLVGGVNSGEVSVNNFEAMEFANKATLEINGQAGDDVISLKNGTQPQDLTTIEVNGNDPTASDTLVVNGNVAAVLTVDTAAGQITNAEPGITIEYDTVEAISVVEGLSRGLTISGSADYTVNFGAQVDEGTVQTATVPISFFGYGSGNTITLTGAGTLTVNGTAGNDAFTVQSSSNVDLTGRATIDPDGEVSLVLNGLEGDDTFTVNAGHAFTTSILLAGGAPSASDTATLNGSGGTVVEVNLGSATPSVTGGGLGTVNLTSIEFATVNNNGGAANTVDINGTAGPDKIDVTPTGTNTVQVQVNGLAPVVTTNNTGALTIDEPNGNADVVTVHGTPGSDTGAADIDVARGANTTVQVGALKLVNVTAANIETLVVDSGLGDDTVNVTGTGGPALTVDGGGPAASDTLTVTLATAGGAATTVVPGSTPDSGAVIDAQDGNVSFLGIEAITLTGAAATDDLVVQGTNGNDAIAVAGSPNRVWVNDRAVVTFSNFDALTLQGCFGDDTFSITPINGVAITAQGGDPTGSDHAVIKKKWSMPARATTS